MGVFMGMRNAIIIQLVAFALIFGCYQLASGQEVTHVVAAGEVFALEWTQATGSEGYEVERALGSGPFEILEEVATNGVTDILGDLQAARYRVRGYREYILEGDTEPTRAVGPYSDPSNRIVGITLPSQPGKPGLVIIP